MVTTAQAPVQEQVDNGQMGEEEMKLRHAAFQREMMMRSANLLMQALSVGGTEVKPLFDKEQRAILEEKLYGILKVL
jgi:hypothetical protein